MDEDLEFEYLSCRYDRWLINRAIKTQQQLAAYTYVVEAFVVYKVRRETKLRLEAKFGLHSHCVVLPPWALHLAAGWAAACNTLVKCPAQMLHSPFVGGGGAQGLPGCPAAQLVAPLGHAPGAALQAGACAQGGAGAGAKRHQVREPGVQPGEGTVRVWERVWGCGNLFQQFVGGVNSG